MVTNLLVKLSVASLLSSHGVWIGRLPRQGFLSPSDAPRVRQGNDSESEREKGVRSRSRERGLGEEEVVEEEMLLVCIYMYVCMYVCMCLRVYVCMRSRVHMMRSRIMYKMRYTSYVNATYYEYEVVESCFF